MAQYIKPSIKLVSTGGSFSTAGACTTTGEDLEILGDIFGITDWNAAFATGEGCQVEYPIEQYCKFTSVNNGYATVILGS